MHLTLLSKDDSKELYDFESINRAYFEQSVPGRGNDYFIYENFVRILDQLLTEHEAGTSYFHLIKDENGTIVGRMNLVDIDEGTGSIGYRIAEAYAGKGLASKALRLLLDIANERYGVTRLYAKTTIDNPSSQRVLEKNGLELIDVRDENGITFKHYEIHL